MTRSSGKLKDTWVLFEGDEPVGTFPWVGSATGYVKHKVGKQLDWQRSDPERDCDWWTENGEWELLYVPYMPLAKDSVDE